MTQRMKPCTSASGRHAWTHVRNKAVQTQATSASVTLALKGLYRCARCPQTKCGAPAFDNAPPHTEVQA